MNPNKNQLQNVRDQLKKFNITATADEIRAVLVDVDEENFDGRLAAEKIMLKKSQSLALPVPKTDVLTVGSKQELIRVQAEELNIQLSQTQIIEIINASNPQVTSAIEFLSEVRELIKEFIQKNNNQYQKKADALVDGIQQVIHAGEIERVQITKGINQKLNEIVRDCKQQNTDFKSPYSNSIQSLRESLFMEEKTAL